MTPDEADATTSQDALLDGRIVLHQPRHGYRSAVDPVLLAAAQDPRPGDRVADLGCGAGVVMLCLLVRLPEIAVIGVERDPHLADLARRNLAANGFADRARVVAADIADAARLAAELGTVDRVVTNPPYHAAGGHTLPDDAAARDAGHEGTVGLEDWLAAAARMVAPRGTLSLIHRADRLVDILRGLPRGFGSVTLTPLWPKAGRPAKRIIVTARRGGRGPAQLAPGLVLHEADGGYTAEATAVLRGGGALDG